MADTSLETWIDGMRSSWGPLTTQLIADCSRHLEKLLAAQATEEWLVALHRDAPANEELYRDAAHGFLLLAHAEYAGLYRPPHDHGRGWVIYAIQQGDIEMGTYARVEGPNGRVRLVKRDSTVLRPGQVKVFLPGDIHDTRCVAGPALLFRFTERDLKTEDAVEHSVTRYVEREGAWTVGAA
jgi:hypothetical protein